ncbi:hypothetical protein Agabi119p4_8069 [Agaricus bisporus var. burnettii]|uniref:Ca3427-like PBP 2 domain-containing protein n=1 Tax=Agaricus bisporus var. burnettii TaxID=192524 RepID=A0A8H7C604_AGABI|nr:hypothetical protein Agabi119p4_8069 [Agaricus bisporus var. burnettii]
MVLRIGYVREHFCSPLLQFAEEDAEKTFTLVECPSGTGQLISRLTNDEIDVAIALTDPLITGIANGSKAYKLVGSYTTTPLNWAVITGVKSPYHKIEDLKDTKIGISRFGSGSYTMAYVLALQNGWSTKDMQFQVNNDIRGLIESVNDGSTSAFLWEHFTTKPFVDAGQCRFIGNIPTPWEAWLIAAHPERVQTEALKTFLQELSNYVQAFDSQESREKKNIDFIKAKFGYPEEDIIAWQKIVGYPKVCHEVSESTVLNTLSVLEKAGVVKSPEGGFKASQFVNTNVAKLV